LKKLVRNDRDVIVYRQSSLWRWSRDSRKTVALIRQLDCWAISSGRPAEYYAAARRPVVADWIANSVAKRTIDMNRPRVVYTFKTVRADRRNFSTLFAPPDPSQGVRTAKFHNSRAPIAVHVNNAFCDENAKQLRRKAPFESSDYQRRGLSRIRNTIWTLSGGKN